jgi:spermidine synthase
MQRNTVKYDLVFIDIFNGMAVPGFVFTEHFLQHCRSSMADGGHLAFNYIVANNEEWAEVQRAFGVAFPGYKVISRSTNKILVV